MTVTFDLFGACFLCGHRNRGVSVNTIRVNARSVTILSGGLFAFPRQCRECGWPLGMHETGRLSEQDRPRVDAAMVRAQERNRKRRAA